MNTLGIFPNTEPLKLLLPEAELTTMPSGFQKSRSVGIAVGLAGIIWVYHSFLLAYAMKPESFLLADQYAGNIVKYRTVFMPCIITDSGK
ncbi:MAG: hypothetical protein IKO72_05935 [Kiritimatiellae bacterium]|nr:hypothetical protein [Kiritimatiellia bacterium]